MDNPSLAALLVYGRCLMKDKKRKKYQEPELLKDILIRVLSGKSYILDCGHRVSFFNHWGNDVTIYNGKKLKIICSQCGY
jgi:hypothetical protein